jgi:hypothetical protein
MSPLFFQLLSPNRIGDEGEDDAGDRRPGSANSERQMMEQRSDEAFSSVLRMADMNLVSEDGLFDVFQLDVDRSQYPVELFRVGELVRPVAAPAF